MKLGPLDAEKDEVFKASWTPDITALPTGPEGQVERGDMADELKISALDLYGGYHSRAARTKRFNDKKVEELEFGRQRRKDEMARRVDGAKGEFVELA